MFLAVACVFQIAMLYSMFVQSLSLIALGILALLTWQGDTPTLQVDDKFWQRLGSFWSHPVWWVITLHFAIVLLGGFYSDDTQFWLTRLRIKAPFLLLPMAFFLIRPISRHTYHTIHASLILVMSLSTLPIIGTIMGDPQAILERLAEGQSIDTPGNHIRYSLLIALASASAIILWAQNFRIYKSWEGRLWLALGIYLFVFAHLLAVRSGLLVLYAALFLLAWLGLIKRIKRQWSAVALVLLVASPILSYLAIPNLRTKIDYTMRDLRHSNVATWSGYSDAQRLRSVQGGLHLAGEHPWIGVGAGDLRSSMKAYFLEHLDKTSFLLPHNQYISIFAGSGLLGLILFLIALFAPLVRYLDEPLLVVLHVVIVLSLLVENTFEVSSGVAIYIFYLGIGLNCRKGE